MCPTPLIANAKWKGLFYPFLIINTISCSACSFYGSGTLFPMQKYLQFLSDLIFVTLSWSSPIASVVQHAAFMAAVHCVYSFWKIPRIDLWSYLFNFIFFITNTISCSACSFYGGGTLFPDPENVNIWQLRETAAAPKITININIWILISISNIQIFKYLNIQILKYSNNQILRY